MDFILWSNKPAKENAFARRYCDIPTYLHGINELFSTFRFSVQRYPTVRGDTTVYRSESWSGCEAGVPCAGQEGSVHLAEGSKGKSVFK